MNLVSRKVAIASGLRHYFTGKICINGHTSKRFVSCNKCVACHNATSLKWRTNNRTKARANTRNSQRKAAGLPPADYPSPEVCESCGKPDPGRHLSLDHCHSRKVFRGWLCMRCNTSAGHLGDTYEGVMKLANYLFRFEQKILITS